MRYLFHLFIIFSLIHVHTATGEEPIQILNLCETSDDIVLASSHTNSPLAVSVNSRDLNSISSNILSAETWLRSNVLAHYPAAKITTILVGNFDSCQQKDLGLVLPSSKNVYHSLTRWGLDKDIKVSVAFHLDCLHPNLKMVKPLIEFLQSVNSTYSLISHFSDKSLNLVSSHLESMKKLGFLYPYNINIVTMVPKVQKTIITRKLSVVESSQRGSFPLRPAPFPEIAEPPLDYPVGYPAPSNVATKPLPPLAQVVSSPPPISFAPEIPPLFVVPASSPYGSNLPPCNPIDNGSPNPMIVPVQKLWCVAKPTVPEETLQEALDYACGEGGADCMEITPQGNCYNPDTVVAHASYAFNSYWQSNKRHGGTCSFGGTAMLINSDPSFLHCQFILS
ncbi:hypothetical protein Lal_00026267 [Lupinus albus]|uniref:glucan endo-1,3-beta-D-glucosidase n=1 Tax=Lupinus albus TaxID=3870 RepID=A0A6A4PZH9_LUPAL|nr:putative glucan endo-1,3-beta-D-glucosidase [Lupinus albus]KAF1861813.1 hypothetical protein Lal_00026267 [Lupinus albus]